MIFKSEIFEPTSLQTNTIFPITVGTPANCSKADLMRPTILRLLSSLRILEFSVQIISPYEMSANIYGHRLYN